jgi:phenylpyruvate tautomerase PptA (4-oxalocrotonate tautomerase family)
MPLLKLQTTASLSDAEYEDLLARLSAAVSEGIGKSEQYVMITVNAGVAICMSGESGDAAFADIRSIGGLDPGVNSRLARAICDVLGDVPGIPSSRVYLNFTNVAATDWGWDGRTFG